MKFSKYFRTYYYQWKNSKRWDFMPTQSKTIISLTTVPSRIEWLKPTLISLLKQKPDLIELNLAQKPLKKDISWIIPPWLTQLNAVQIFWLEHDYGPASKFIPTIERHQQEDCKIIVVDDDMIYPKNFLSKLLQADTLSDQKSVFCTSGHKIHRDLDSSHLPSNDKNSIGYERVAIIQGCGGYLIRPGYFKLEVLKQITELPGNSAKQDDVWISGLLSKYNIPKFRVPIKNRRGTINTLTSSIIGDRVEPFNTVLQYFKRDWHDEEYDSF